MVVAVLALLLLEAAAVVVVVLGAVMVVAAVVVLGAVMVVATVVEVAGVLARGLGDAVCSPRLLQHAGAGFADLACVLHAGARSYACRAPWKSITRPISRKRASTEASLQHACWNAQCV